MPNKRMNRSRVKCLNKEYKRQVKQTEIKSKIKEYKKY